MSFMSADEAREERRLRDEVGRSRVEAWVNAAADLLDGRAPGQEVTFSEPSPVLAPSAQIILPDGTARAVPLPSAPRVNPGPKLYEITESNWAFETQAPPEDPDPSRGVEIGPMSPSPIYGVPFRVAPLGQYGFVSWKASFASSSRIYVAKADGVYDIEESDLKDGRYQMVLAPDMAYDLSSMTVVEDDEDEEDPVWTDV